MTTRTRTALYLDRFVGSLGTYLLASTGTGLLWLAPEEQRPVLPAGLAGMAGMEQRFGGNVNAQCAAELKEYFDGRRMRFSVPLDLHGTDFQQQVWRTLLSIPYGETRSYAGIARAVGRPMASRAVGGAVGSNPIAILVPCHRVVGANGTLTGYAGGLDRKRVLLALETRRRFALI